MNNIFEIISKKGNGINLEIDEIKYFLDSIQNNSIDNSQISALLMAIYINGMNQTELSEYTRGLINSGKQITHDCNGFIIDKHSTGGVGDKVSFIVGPILAALGYYVPMVAGRSLGFTGGTIDKLESISGYDVNLGIDKFKKNVKDIGISIIAQTDFICPLDRKIYSIRDLTATIASTPLIAGSIMSKKIAEGVQGLIIDMKIGKGTFIKNKTIGQQLIGLMHSIAKNYDIKFNYIMSSMDHPLGKTSGLYTEIEESIDSLKGKGESELMKVVYSIAMKSQELAGDSISLDKINQVISSGMAYEIFNKMISSHGGDLSKSNNVPSHEILIYSDSEGYINSIDAKMIGLSNVIIGCGRINHKSILDYSAGIEIIRGVGKFVRIGDPIIRAFCSNINKLDSIRKNLSTCFIIDQDKKDIKEIIIE